MFPKCSHGHSYAALKGRHLPARTFCELGEQARFAASSATNPDYRIYDEDDAAFVKAIKDIIDRFANDGIRVFPVVLDSETQFEVFFGVEYHTRELLDLMGDKVLTEEYEDSPDIFVAW